MGRCNLRTGEGNAKAVRRSTSLTFRSGYRGSRWGLSEQDTEEREGRGFRAISLARRAVEGEAGARETGEDRETSEFAMEGSSPMVSLG